MRAGAICWWVHGRIVRASVVLAMNFNWIAVQTATAIVVELGVAVGFIESGIVEPVVQPVHHVKRMRDCSLGLVKRAVRRLVWIEDAVERIRTDGIWPYITVVVPERRGEVGIGIGVVAGSYCGIVRQPGIIGTDRTVLQRDEIGRDERRLITIRLRSGVWRIVATRWTRER